MAHINGKNIPFVYHAVPVTSTVRVETGLFTAEGGETSFIKRDFDFKPDIVIWILYDYTTEPTANITFYAIRDNITYNYFNILLDGTLGDSSAVRPIRLYNNGFVAFPNYDSGTTFSAGDRYQWIAIKTES